MTDTVRTALVTGAAQGLGRAIADSLAEAGMRVCYADVDGDRATLAARSAPGQAMAVQMDVTQRPSIRTAVAQVHDQFGPIEVLVNNAARTVSRPFFEITEEEWDQVIAVNLRGLVLTAQEVLPDMLDAGWGRVINLSSLAGQRGGPQVQGIHYASSKAGIIGATRYIADEFAAKGITVNCIAPGPVLTEATAKAPPEKLAMVAGAIPVGRIGEAAEVGALARYITSEQAGFVTGMTFDINGGLLMR